MVSDRQSHWEEIYKTKREAELSWFQASPALVLDLLELVGATPSSSIVDIGGGESRLVDSLLAEGYENITVLDLSATALAAAQSRLGEKGDKVKWIVADATEWEPPEFYDIWHDRAAFHFLVSESEQRSYIDRLKRGLKVGGHVILGTFALDGPQKCSGLPVARHGSASLSNLLGSEFALVDSRRDDHTTPRGSVQRFQFSTFKRMHA